MTEYILIYELENPNNESNIIGPDNKIISLIEEVIGCEIILKQAEVKISENNLAYKENIIKLFKFLEKIYATDIHASPRDIINIVQSIKDGKDEQLLNLYLN